MKYYKIKYDLNPKVVGSDYPQSWNFTKEYEKRTRNSNSIYQLDIFIFRKHEQPDFTPDLDGFVLSGRAKLTDFISVTSCRTLFMSEIAKDILQSKCNYGSHEFYEATLYVRKQPVTFYCLGIFCDFYAQIEFPKCRYAIYGVEKEEDLPQEWYQKSINNLQDVFKIERKIPYPVDIWLSKIVLKKTAKETDLLYYYVLGIRIGIVTERFKEAVEEAGLTGLVFEPIEVEFEE